MVLDLVILTKPRIVLLLVLSGVLAGYAAAGGQPDPARLAGFALAGGMAAAGAAAFNHFVDRDVDGHMDRTAARPLPAGRLEPLRALEVGAVLSLAGVSAAAVLLGGAVALVLLAGIAVYAGLYSLWLKRRTAWNIVLGGTAGSLMVLAGWVSQTGTPGPGAWLLFAWLFLWTPSHFWPLAIVVRDEYARAGIPMLPVAAGPRLAAWITLANTLALVALSLIPALWGWYRAGPALAVAAAGAVMVALNLAVALAGPGRRERLAWRLYKLSGPYLGWILAVFALALAGRG
ncbi:protoheme IX farnesyltransferase [Thermaerobacter sp. PB12/4term]|uniref:heme o synthase n=1 Tax=Thermaerobacter sp. PB12/4term TaxID=2293838 RepID=UPI001313EA8F|nr:heme o synthase [Thermaerobacter sp. PB12/4term]QIA27526.1 protoheme IX farnesyltransferase [Thermaerobacter sp. PB12/4term]